jgi:hypothetical protein
VTSIEETDENAPEPEPVKEPPKEEHVEEVTLTNLFALVFFSKCMCLMGFYFEKA